MEMIEEFCPAKVNLFLAITGRRADGFHELVSVMAPLNIGDRLRVAVARDGKISFSCDDPSLPRDSGNLVLQAVEAFRRRHPFEEGLRIALEKQVPAGAGLGGGSSDAAGTLLALNRLFGFPLKQEALTGLAATIGSDCPFFLEKKAAVVRGRGEQISPLPEASRKKLRGVRLLLMKPSFAVCTAWAYQSLARAPETYCRPEWAEERLAAWVSGECSIKELLFNNMENKVFEKFIPLGTLKDRLTREGGLTVLMSGSGSTLFAILENDSERRSGEEWGRDAFGDAGWIREATLI